MNNKRPIRISVKCRTDNQAAGFHNVSITDLDTGRPIECMAVNVSIGMDGATATIRVPLYELEYEGPATVDQERISLGPGKIFVPMEPLQAVAQIENGEVVPVDKIEVTKVDGGYAWKRKD